MGHRGTARRRLTVFLRQAGTLAPPRPASSGPPRSGAHIHRITDEGRIRVFAEHNVDFEHGATDDQLFDQVQCGLSTALQFYEALESELGV